MRVYGDSHALALFSAPGYEMHYLGPWTMRRVGRDGLEVSPPCVTVFGEIDARCHVGLHEDRLGYMTRICEDYTSALRKYQDKGRIVVCGIMPPTDANLNPEFPFVGTITERKTYTVFMNDLLWALCSGNLVFLPIYELYADGNGVLDPRKSDGTVHAKDGLPARKRLESIRSVV